MDINMSIISGRLTKKPEPYTTGEGGMVVSFTVAVNRRKDKDGNERPANFIPVTFFGKTADNAYKILDKGDQVTVQGAIDVSNYEKDSEQRTYTKILGEKFHKFGKRPLETDQKDDF